MRFAGAIEGRITTAQDDAKQAARANEARDEIEREITARSAVIASFLGSPATSTATESEPASSTKSRRGSQAKPSRKWIKQRDEHVKCQGRKDSDYLPVRLHRGPGDARRAEGFSTPVQREANTHKAESIGAVMIEEFVDTRESGTSSTKRPELWCILAWVREY